MYMYISKSIMYMYNVSPNVGIMVWCECDISWVVLNVTIFSGYEAVDLWDSDNVGQHITEPLGVDEVEVAEGRSGVV